MPIHYVAVLGESSKAPLSFYKGLNQGEVIETDKIAEAKQFKTAKERIMIDDVNLLSLP